MGLISKTLGFGLAALVGAAFATCPSEPDVRELLRERIEAQIDAGAGVAPDDDLGQVLLGICQVSPRNCASLVEQIVDLDYENRILWGNVTIGGRVGEGTSCVAIFSRLVCN